MWSSRLPRRVRTHNKWGLAVDKRFEKGEPADVSGKVMPLPVVNRVKFYREHMNRSIEAIRSLWQDFCHLQDCIYAEMIEFENAIMELQDEIDRLERIYGKEDKVDR